MDERSGMDFRQRFRQFAGKFEGLVLRKRSLLETCLQCGAADVFERNKRLPVDFTYLVNLADEWMVYRRHSASFRENAAIGCVLKQFALQKLQGNPALEGFIERQKHFTHSSSPKST